MTLKRITDATEEPVTLEEAKVHLRIEADLTVDDALITDLIKTAREMCEQQLGGRALMTQTWERVLDAFPAAEIELGMPPVASITSVKYFDVDGVEQTMATDAYSLDADNPPGWVLPAIDTEWPDTLDTANAVRVRFVCGDALAASVPSVAKTWIKIVVSDLYPGGDKLTEDQRKHIDRLLDRPRVFWG
jgi:uncharacterized phiE125 gp8 family phage protein